MYFNVVGIVYRRLGLLDEATTYSKRALQIDKNMVAAKMNIANTELQKGEMDQAIMALNTIVRENPGYNEAKANLALAYKNSGKLAIALNIYGELEFLGPWSLKAKFNYGITLITTGSFMEGWRYYEYRWKVSPGNKITWPFQHKPVWKEKKGKRVVLWKEQGIGDDIIFLSLVPEVKEMCSSLSVYVDPRLNPYAGELCQR